MSLSHKNGHKSDVCRNKLKNYKALVSLTEEDLFTVVTDVNMVESNPKEWWYNTWSIFITYQRRKIEEKLFMGNTEVSKIESHSKVILKMSYRLEVTVKKVKHMPNMRKNLVSGTFFTKNGFAMTIEADKLVIQKNGV